MDSSFNMDFILGGVSAARKTVGTSSSTKGTVRGQCEEETVMLPDSSLSPSNLHCVYMVQGEAAESKLAVLTEGGTHRDSGSSKKKKMMIMGDVIGDSQCRVVRDRRGDEYLVAEEHLVPLVEVRHSVFDSEVQSPSKECTTTTTSSNIVTNSLNVTETKADLHVHNQLDDNNNNTDNNNNDALSSFLYASQLALVEVKLKDLEKELLSLDKYSFSRFVNSATNLKVISEESRFSQTYNNNSNNNNYYCEATTSSVNVELVNDNPEVVIDKDDIRRSRLRQIITKHSQLKRWLSKIKRKLKEKNVMKLCRIIDFSSREESQLPLPPYLEAASQRSPVKKIVDQAILVENDEHVPTSLIKFNVKDKNHISHLSQILDYNCPQDSQHEHEQEDDSGNNIVEDKYQGEEEEDRREADIFEETAQDRSQFHEKNIFSAIQSFSKEGSDPEGIPHLTYEYENCRDSDIRHYKDIKCNFDDQVVSTASSDCQNNQNPPTPDLRRAELDCNDISEGIRVLVVQKDYLRAGVIHLTNGEDSDQKLWRVTLDGDRKCQDIVISEWQLLEQGVREVIPTSISQLGPGTRVCANWSVQLPLNLYPGTITQSSLECSLNLHKLSIDFDDGDHKDIDLNQVRLLPENFPNLHELMKASHFEDSNFYSSDRKNRVKKTRHSKAPRVLTIGIDKKNQNNKELDSKVKKKSIKTVDKKKKLIVNWKLMKEADPLSHDYKYELVRNIDNLHILGGENIQLLSYSRHNYMANVVRVLARQQSTVMDIELNWYYILSDVQDNSEIIKKLKKSRISKKIIFKTSHCDVNDVYSVLRKVEVLPFDEYKLKYLRKYSRTDVPVDSYVMAGLYNQTKTKVESLDENIRHYILSGGD